MSQPATVPLPPASPWPLVYAAAWTALDTAPRLPCPVNQMTQRELELLRIIRLYADALITICHVLDAHGDGPATQAEQGPAPRQGVA